MAWKARLGDCDSDGTHHLHSSPHPQPYMSVVSVVLTCSAAPRSRAPPSPIALSPSLPVCKHKHWPGSMGLQVLQHTHSESKAASKSTFQPHSSAVSVVLTCSAAPRSRAPSSPMLLKRRLAKCKCERALTQDVGLPLCLQSTHKSTHRPISRPDPDPQPHMSVFSVVLTRSAAPRSRAPAAPMLLRKRLLMCKCEHSGAPSLQLQLINIHIEASLQLCQRRVDLQRRAQVPCACSADVVVCKAAHVRM
jgi:hypothetical protein